MRELEQHFNKMYDKFKLMLYDRALKERGGSSADELSLQEVIYMEIIIALGAPTAAEFSAYAKLSAPNTAYRLNRLEEKGYVIRTRSDYDRREYHVEATEKYRDEYGVIFDYIHLVCDRIEERFTPDEVAALRNMMGIISGELMPEAGNQLRERAGHGNLKK